MEKTINWNVRNGLVSGVISCFVLLGTSGLLIFCPWVLDNFIDKDWFFNDYVYAMASPVFILLPIIISLFFAFSIASKSRSLILVSSIFLGLDLVLHLSLLAAFFFSAVSNPVT
jgi:hypothetical protein